MARIFVSHASADNAAALALGQWLTDRGFDDYFLDISRTGGLMPGDRWQDALKAASNRCVAVIFIVSSAWLESHWCVAEFLFTKQLGKSIFSVLIEPIAVDALLSEMTAEWQICDLAAGNRQVTFEVEQDPLVPATNITFAAAGLDRLERGLHKAGVGGTTFSWPPSSEPNRSPYPGLRALEAEDAAVFFGREADIVRGLDALRRMRERRVERLLVILGASGAGKSSFLRAGLWPRLIRGDLFYPLSIVRPQRRAIGGAVGLAASFEQAFADRQMPRSRASISRALEEPWGLGDLLTEVMARHDMVPEQIEFRRTPLIAIDQGEELFEAENREEADQLVARLVEVLTASTIDRADVTNRRAEPLVI